MQNPLRRPGGAPAPAPAPAPTRSHPHSRGHSRDYPRNNPQPFFDAERQHGHGDERESLSKTMQGHVVAMSGEFVGTTMFLFFAFGGTQIANTLPRTDVSQLDRLLYISLCFGFSLAVTAWVFYRISGGLFNPAVCIDLGVCELKGTDFNI